MPTLITPRPFRPALTGNQVLIIGDSLSTSGNTYEDGGIVGAVSWFTWMRALLGDSLSLSSDDGVGGETTTEVLARVDTTAQKTGDLAIVMAGANDITQDVPAQVVIDNLETITRRFWDEGKHVVLCNLTPNTGVNTTARETAFEAVNAWIATLPKRAPNLTTVDLFSALGTAPDTPKSGVLYDSVHFSESGAALVGQTIADAVSDLFPTRFTEWHGPDSDSNAIGNPLFETDALGWTERNSTQTVSSSTEHEGNIVTLTASGATSDVRTDYLENIADARFASGDVLVLKAELEWDVTAVRSALPTISPYLFLASQNTDDSIDTSFLVQQTQTSFRVNADNAPLSGRGVWRTPEVTVAGTVDRLIVRFGLTGLETGSVTCHRLALYKV